MTKDDTEITISIPASKAAQSHIEHLQTTLAKRNMQIEQLKERLAEAESGEPNQRSLAMAYQRGWKAAAAELIEATRVAATSLGKVRKEAFDIYLQAERQGFGE